jgi:6-phosphogluconate dehydrogenase
MKIGLIGLGRMGIAIAHRLIHAQHDVIGFDQSSTARSDAQKIGVSCAKSIQDVALQARVIWLMVPAGKIIDDVLSNLSPKLLPNDVIIDGGNSFFKNSVDRAQMLATKNIFLLDCGTSGGLHGKKNGFSLMIGGDKEIYEKMIPIFEAIAAPSGYIYVGPSGSGHFVKMVHNGIEYGMLQAYAEGFQVLKEGPYKNLNLTQIAEVWNHGAIIRSWILELAQQIFARDQELKDINGAIGENLTGAWMVKTAHELKIPVRVIEHAQHIREWSRETGGNYATKVVAMLRHEFGGHEVKIKKS